MGNTGPREREEQAKILRFTQKNKFLFCQLFLVSCIAFIRHQFINYELISKKRIKKYKMILSWVPQNIGPTSVNGYTRVMLGSRF